MVSALLWAALASATPVPMGQAARPVPVGMVEIEARATLLFQGAGGAVSGRLGLTEDADLALSWVPLVGASLDGRYRFWRRGPLHLAYAPGFSFRADPGRAFVAESDLRAPLVLEWEVSRIFSLGGEARLSLNQRWYRAPGPPPVRGSVTALIPAVGWRAAWNPRRFTLALSGLAGWDLVRHGLPPEGGLQIDLSFRFGPWPE